MTWLRRILTLGLFAIAALIAFTCWKLVRANAMPVTISYVIGEIENVEQWIALLAAFSFGAAVVGIAVVYGQLRFLLMRRQYRRRVADLEGEVHQLRNLPLAVDREQRPSDQSESVAASSA
jgi:hypothetical protein